MAISRRGFLIGSGIVGGGLVLGFSLASRKPAVPGTIAGSFQPNAWLQITPDGRVIFQLHKVEMGQGVMTALPVLIGEELDFDPARFEIAMAGVHPDFVAGAVGTQITGGSNSVASSWEPLRQAGAAARAMLMAAAAQRWGITVEQCATDNGEVINRVDQRRLSYFELADAARSFSDVSFQLKSADAYRWIGRDLPRLDAVAKANGTAQFGVDVDLPGMKVAVIVRCPHFGGGIKQWQPDSVRTSSGIIDVFVVHSGIAIVAEGYWQARKAAQKLAVVWEKGPLAGLNSAAIRDAQQQALTTGEPHLVLEHGDFASVNMSEKKTFKAQYFVPHTHHSPMEPQNATALYSETDAGNRCEVWAPNQAPDICRALIAHYGNVSHDNAIIHTTLLGGGFGRRGYPDYVAEAVAIARQMPGTPIKLMWSREDDMRHDFYRPSSLHALEASLDDSGGMVSWKHTFAAPSILRGFGVYIMSAMLPTWVPTAMARSLGGKMGETFAGYDPTLADGAKIPYNVEHVAVGYVEHDPGVPIGFWRSVGFSYNAFVIESFIDELSHRAGFDPLLFRLQHLADAPRHRAVLELVAEKSHWGSAPEGIRQGIAVAEPFGTCCAMVAEVSVTGDEFSVERVVAAVHCGRLVAPDVAKSQIEGGILYGLSAALKAPVLFSDGSTVQSNFHDLPVLRIDEAPKIEVYFVDSEDNPTGLGEIGVPAIAPAVANALFAATGRRLRQLPLQLNSNTV